MKTPRAQLWDEIAETAALHGVPLKMLRSSTKKRRVVACRHAVFYQLRKKYGFSYPQIGKAMNVDHTTVLNGIGRHLARNRIDDPDYAHLRRKAEMRSERAKAWWHERGAS